VSALNRISHALFLTIARMLLVAWIGGAALFVITSIAEQRRPEFDSATKDRLATVRFPLYYQFGTFCLGTSIAATTIATVTAKREHRKRLIAALTLCILSAGIAAYDYMEVYLPLQEAITPPGQVRGPDFITLHKRSATVNEIHISLALLAAILICVPNRTESPRQQ
jgi:hypothetical protein